MIICEIHCFSLTRRVTHQVGFHVDPWLLRGFLNSRGPGCKKRDGDRGRRRLQWAPRRARGRSFEGRGDGNWARVSAWFDASRSYIIGRPRSSGAARRFDLPVACRCRRESELTATFTGSRSGGTGYPTVQLAAAFGCKGVDHKTVRIYTLRLFSAAFGQVPTRSAVGLRRLIEGRCLLGWSARLTRLVRRHWTDPW